MANRNVFAATVGVCVLAGTALGGGAPPAIDHVVVLVLENRGFEEIIGDPDAPYLNSLAQGGAVCTAFSAMTHPSQPNYFEFFSGWNQGIQDNANPAPGSPFSTPNLASAIIQAGRTFVSYSESLPYVGYTGAVNGGYTRLVNPCASWQSSNPGPNQISPQLNRPFSDFPADFSNLPSVSFVVPTIAHSMHDNTVASGDAWVQAHIGPYATWAMAHNSLLIVTFDEDSNVSRNRIGTIFYGPMVRLGTIEASCTLVDLLRTICDIYGAVPPGRAAQAARIPGLFADENLAVRRAFRQGYGGYTSAQDTWMDSTAPNLQKGTTPFLFTGATRQALVRFDDLFGAGPDRVPYGATILSAKLTFLVGADRSRDTFSLHRMLVPWHEGSTWNSMVNGVSTDDVEAASAAEFETVPNIGSTWTVFDITEAAQAWSDGTQANYGFLLHSSGNDLLEVRSGERAQAGDRPMLEIVFDGGSPCVGFAQQPQSQSVVRGQSVAFEAPVNSSEPVTYQWLRGGVPISDGDGYSGTGTTTLTISPADFLHAGSYSLRATASCAAITSSAAALQVTCDVVPTINGQPPSSYTVGSGATATLSVSALASGSVQYQWQRSYSDDFVDIDDGGNLSGTHTASLVISPAGAQDTADYRVIVYSDCAQVISQNCFFAVLCQVDFNNDGFVNGDDFDGFMSAFTLGEQSADYNGDTFVTGDDFDEFTWDFDAGC